MKIFIFKILAKFTKKLVNLIIIRAILLKYILMIIIYFMHVDLENIVLISKKNKFKMNKILIKFV